MTLKICTYVIAIFSSLITRQMIAAPEDVKVGAYINDIHHIDLSSHSFQADIYVWVKWQHATINPSMTLEIMNPFELWALDKSLIYDEPVKLPEGLQYQVLRLQGSFAEKFDLAKYPFDVQNLHVELEDAQLDAAGLKFVKDIDEVVLNPMMKLPGYEIGKPVLKILSVNHPTSFGDTRPERANRNYSRVSIEIPISRPKIPNALKLLIPVLCVMFCASLMFMFDPKYVDSRVGIGITALLTVVALQITLNEDLPEINYVVLIDKVYLVTYVYVILGLATVVKTTWMIDRETENLNRAIKLDKISLISLTTIYMVIVATLIGAALS